MVSSRPLPLNVAPEKELGYGQIFTALLRRKHWLILGLLGGLAVSAVTSLRQAPSYSSSMQVLIEPIYQGKTQGPAKQTDEVTDSNVQVDSATQISFLQSSGLVKKAMLSLQSEYPEYNPDDAGSVTEFKRNLLVIQAASADKKATTPTKIFQITYQGNNPAKTQQVLNALQKVYLDYNREQQALRLTKGLTFIDQQLPTIGKKLQLSESRLEGFRRNQELIDPKLEAQRQSDQFGKAQDELKTSISQIQELRSRYETLEQQLPMSPAQTAAMGRLTQSMRYQSLLSEIQKTELALVQQRLRFKDGTPYVQQILDQRQQQLSLLQAEAGRVLGETTVLGEGLLAAGQLTPQDIATMTQFSDATVGLRAAEARYSGLQQNVEILRGNLKRFPQLLAEYGRLEPEVELNRDTLKQLLKSRQELGMEIARGSFDWQIVEEPQLGMKTNAPVSQSLLLGAITGLFLGGIMAFTRESMDDAVHTSDDIQRQFPVPLLGMIPSYTELSKSISIPRISWLSTPNSDPMLNQFIHWQPFRESLDLIYQNLQLLDPDGGLKSIVITSALAGEGKSTLALGLAMSAARFHRRVLLIDGDLRSPSLHTMLGLPNEIGLMNLLSTNSPIPLIQSNTDEPEYGNLAVLTAGTGSIAPAQLLSSQRLRRLISTFEKSYDLVIIDAPPTLGMVDTMLLSSWASGVVIVGRIGKVTRSELTQASHSLGQLNLIGVVANDIELKALSPLYEKAVAVT
jgi:capsular exopolysaccharide synthesis family protein